MATQFFMRYDSYGKWDEMFRGVNMTVVDYVAPIHHEDICNHHFNLWWLAE